MGQVRAVSQGWGVEEGGWQGRGHGRGRRRGVSAREALRARDEAWEGLQGGGGGDWGGEPGVQLQTGAQGAGGRAAEGEQGGGGVLELDGTHLQLLLPTPLGPSVLEPHLRRERRIFYFQFNFIYLSLQLTNQANRYTQRNTFKPNNQRLKKNLLMYKI